MKLNLENLDKIQTSSLSKPSYLGKNLPEKIIQFGTGVLLKGLPCYFIDAANNTGQFNGRILAVKSTPDNSETENLAQQDYLYTLHSQGVSNRTLTESTQILGSVSRIVHAHTHWNELLKAAQNPAIQIAISNTTEIGLNAPSPADYQLDTPNSFPAKLLKLLKARFNFFAGDPTRGWIIIPTELVVNNAMVLKQVLVNLAQANSEPAHFIDWLQTANTFCNSLVDRIVTGKPSNEKRQILEQKLGYQDPNLICSETYSLWAIEANTATAQKLTFANPELGCIVTTNIEQYRELKLRLLNAVHTSMVGYALALGHKTVYEATQNLEIVAFIKEVQQETISVLDINPAISAPYAAEVLARFQNPAIEHKLLGITVQYSSKMKARVLPLIHKYIEKHDGQAPKALLKGFEYFLKFMEITHKENDHYFGEINGEKYQIIDQNAEAFFQKTKNEILQNEAVWGNALSYLKQYF
jgi:tagaturonate reductase